jgi:hypothetical protein
MRRIPPDICGYRSEPPLADRSANDFHSANSVYCSHSGASCLDNLNRWIYGATVRRIDLQQPETRRPLGTGPIESAFMHPSNRGHTACRHRLTRL